MSLRLRPAKIRKLGFSSQASAALCAAVAALFVGAFSNAGHAAEFPKNTSIDRLDQPALKLSVPVAAELQTVIRSGDRLIAIGQRGAIIYSDDEGQNWTQAPAPVSVALTAIASRPDGVVIAVGHDAAILRSTDNGETWRKITDGRKLLPERINDMAARYEKAKALYDAHQAKLKAAEEAAAEAAGSADAAASAEADASSEGAVAEAADASATDAATDAPPEGVLDEFALEDLDFRVDTMRQSMEFGPAWPFLDVLFLSDDPKESRALALGAFGTAYLSEDAGQSWTLISDRFENPTDLHLNNGFVTKTGAVIVGSEQGFIFRSAKGAEKFEPIETFDGFSFFDMNLVPGTDKIIAYGFGDTYHFSTDDGVSWASAPLSESMSLAGNVVLPTGGLGIMGDGGQMFEIGPDGEKRRFRPIETRKMLGAAIPISGSRVLFVSEIGVTIADKF